ncbi:hypothetical protein BpHYR1_038137 [Brachionus plicatilis]|uniref:Uncharacterized protein n=1 Tax=Brachionus plicatilis TaxID=10195 RepID=A0A3M7PGI0_BRAPC|nr:hypothetical protein BpHYR1_038137 [Brachionus plicatilis]
MCDTTSYTSNVVHQKGSLSKIVKFCQPENDSIAKCQSQMLIYHRVNISCNGFAKCNVNFDSGEINKSCFSDGKSINVDYECQMSEVKDDPCKLCGYGSICNNLNEKVECSCPIGADGDPKFRCCKPMKCRVELKGLL